MALRGIDGDRSRMIGTDFSEAFRMVLGLASVGLVAAAIRAIKC